MEVNPVPPPPLPPGNSRPTDPVPAPPTPDIVYPIEVAPPPVSVPRPPRAPGPPPRLPPSPQVNSQPYTGNGGGSGSGYNIGGSGPQQPRDPMVTQGYSGTGGYIGGGYGMMQPQQVQYLPMNVGCIPCLMTSQMQQELVDENVCPGHTQCIVNEQVQTYGRSNEDDAIFEIFYTNPMKCCGTIVEIGAGDGLTGSASYFFQHAMDWNSIVTEANPVDFDKIADNRQGDKLATINGAFCLESERISFDGASGNFKQHHADEYTSEVVVKELPNNDKVETIDCIRLDRHVLAGLDHVDVMVIRVKGDPWAVIRTMDWNVQVDVWVILMEEKEGMHHDALRACLRSHEYVPAAWDVKLWCDTPKDCMENEVWLRKNFNPLPQQQQTLMMGMHGMQARGLRGSSGGMFLPYQY